MIPRNVFAQVRTEGSLRQAQADTDSAGGDVRDWKDLAACVGKDPTLFFAPSVREHPDAAVWRISEAKDICRDCPVTVDCLTWALTVGDGYAVLGGATPDERSKMGRVA